MNRRRSRVGVVITCVAASACTDAVPTSDDGGLIPIEAETFAVELPFSSFAADFRTFSGFGEAAELPARYMAHEWEGELEAYTLLQFGELETVNARPPDSGVTRPDSMYTVVSAQLVLTMDTTNLRGPPAITLHADAILTPWDRDSASWELAVDTLGSRIPWPEPGGGPVREVDEADWAHPVSDTVRFDIDSITAREWIDPDLSSRGVRLRSGTEGTRIQVLQANLEVSVRPSINPDTLVVVEPEDVVSTFIYDPSPATPEGAMQIGGVPAHRATFRLTLPESVDPGGETCQRIECPVELSPERILHAGLGLYSHPGLSPGLTPLDTTPVELRPALSPDRLPRSPLGCPVRGCGAPTTPLAPELFDGEAGTPIELSVSAYVRALLEEPGEGEDPPSATLTLLAGPNEPATLEPAVFYAPGSEFEPYLRLILTLSEGLTLP